MALKLILLAFLALIFIFIILAFISEFRFQKRILKTSDKEKTNINPYDFY